MKFNTQKISIGRLVPNPNNPRVIKDAKYKKLVQSIKDFPEMLELRPVVVGSDYVILGGNMRYRACIDAGLREIPIIIADSLDDRQKEEFIIKDNVGFGEWDWEILANNWDSDDLSNWGLDVPKLDNKYTSKIVSPIYEPTTVNRPKISDLYSLDRYNMLISAIEKAMIGDDLKAFLKLAATRFISFDFRNIAEYYSHSVGLEEKELFTKLALVIIDYDRAIENGFISLSETLAALSNE